MARCRRCNSFLAVGRVKTMSPNYRAPSEDAEGRKYGGGRSEERYICMSCIVKLEQWMDGKDQRLPGQSGLEESTGSLGTNRTSTGPFGPLLEWLVREGMES